MRWIRNRQRAIENWLGPFLSGLVEALIVCFIFASSLWGISGWVSLADPTAHTLRDLVQVGSAVFIAFAVSTSGAAVFTGGDLKTHLNWLGATCGIGLTSFTGILGSVALAAYREAGHFGVVDLLGLSWILTGILLPGCMVAALPYAMFRWSRSSSVD